MRQNGSCFIPPGANTGEFNVYGALNVNDANADKFFRRMNTGVVQGAERNPNVVFCDATNFFFEIPDADVDVPGDNGIPISFKTFHGNALDHRCCGLR